MAKQRDEVGRSGIYPPDVPAPDDAKVITPGDINEGHTGRGRGKDALVPTHEDVKRDERGKVKGAERLPRKGDELDDMGDKPTD